MTGEQKQFIAELVEEYGKGLTKMARLYTKNADLAEDLVQETLLIACCRVDVLAVHENKEGWLHKTLWNLATREMSKAYHGEVPLSLDFAEGSPGLELPMELYLPRELKDKEREIILMRIDEGMSYAQIAAAKGITESACRQQLSRVVRKCRKLMQKMEDGALSAQ